jgi:alanyl-tRNA synthetase
MAKSYHPPMHTTEHILNQTMLQMFTDEKSFSAHLERRKSKCDYRFHRNLTDKEVNSLQEKVNEVINRNLDVEESFINIGEAKKNYSLSKLPDNTGDEIRIIQVGDYDSCLCIGEHVQNTKEIGTFKIISTSYDNEILRIRFKLAAKERTDRL